LGPGDEDLVLVHTAALGVGGPGCAQANAAVSQARWAVQPCVRA